MCNVLVMFQLHGLLIQLWNRASPVQGHQFPKTSLEFISLVYKILVGSYDIFLASCKSFLYLLVRLDVVRLTPKWDFLTRLSLNVYLCSLHRIQGRLTECTI